MDTGSAKVVEVGEFELNLHTAELRRNGTRTRLAEQPFQILRTLLERPGELVTREDLQRRLWPNGTFVDFEHSLNTAVKKLRQVLGDDAEKPRYIETVPRRGYRLVAEVRIAASAASGNGNSALSEAKPESNAEAAAPSNGDAILPLPEAQTAIFAGQTAPAAGIPERQRAKDKPGAGRLALAAGGVIIIGLALGLIYFKWSGRAGVMRPPKTLRMVQLSSDGQLKAGEVLDEGSRIFFEEYVNGKWEVASVSVRGGETRIFPTPLEHQSIQDISSDGTEMLLISRDGPGGPPPATKRPYHLFTMSTEGGELHQVGSFNARQAAFSLDGEQIVYASNQDPMTDLYVVNRDGTGNHLVLRAPGVPIKPHFSPDGSTIRFSLMTPKSFEHALWEVRADGSDAHQVFPGWHSYPLEGSGSWNRDGSYFLFGIWDNNSDMLCVVPEKGRALKWLGHRAYPLSTGVIDPVGDYTFSNESNRIFLIGAERHARFIQLDAKTGEWANYLPALSGESVSLNSNGKWAAYVDPSTHSLWRARTDGTDRLRLTFPPVVAAQPAWSPTGAKIAFEAKEPGKPQGVYVVNTEGGLIRRIGGEHQRNRSPSWSPDGTHLLYTEGDARTGPHSLQIFDFVTGKTETVPGTQNLHAPEWSPDGRSIAATTGDAAKSNARLAIYSFASRKWSFINVPVGEGPMWSHDAKSLYFWGMVNGGFRYFRVRLSDRKVERIREKTNWTVIIGALGPWFGLSRQDEFVAPRDNSVFEIYALDWQGP